MQRGGGGEELSHQVWSNITHVQGTMLRTLQSLPIIRGQSYIGASEYIADIICISAGHQRRRGGGGGGGVIPLPRLHQ